MTDKKDKRQVIREIVTDIGQAQSQLSEVQRFVQLSTSAPAAAIAGANEVLDRVEATAKSLREKIKGIA